MGQTNITTIVLVTSPNRNESFKRRFKINPKFSKAQFMTIVELNETIE